MSARSSSLPVDGDRFPRCSAQRSLETHRAASASQVEVISTSTARDKNAEDRIAQQLALAKSMKDIGPKPSSARGRSSSVELHARHVSPENVKRRRVQTSAPLSANAHATAAKPPCKRPIHTDAVGTAAHSVSAQSQAASSSSSQWQEPTQSRNVSANVTRKRPAAIFDTRFLADKKKRMCKCDHCGAEVKYRNQSTPFEGNFLYPRVVPAEYANQPWSLETKERAWRAGLWDATWLCVPCLSVHHECDRAYVFENLIGNFAEQRAKAKAKVERRRRW